MKTIFIVDIAGVPVSNATEDGMVNLEAALSRILNLGEEVED